MPFVSSTARHLRDPAGVLVIAGFTSLVSQRWTGFNSPDSEFYASLALFGSDVTDRAIEPAYTWTRLGYIVPVRLLTAAFGPWVGFEIWRIALIVMVVAAVYAVVAIAGRSRVLAVGLSLAVSLNTVILAYVGNTYLTGTILAATFVLLALAVSQLGSAAHQGNGPLGSPRWATAAVSGAVAGWLLMLNPYALILGLGLWIAVRVVVLVRIPRQRWSRLGVDALAAAGGFGVAVGLLLLAGRWVFPALNWWQTYLEWNERLDYTVFIGDATTWQRDTALLVIVLALVASTVAVITHPRHRWAWAALALSVANILVTVVVMAVMPGPWLETPTYVAKLWPAALLSLVLVFTSMSPGSKEGKSLHSWFVAVGIAALVPVLIWSGRFDGVLSYGQGVAIAVVTAAVVITALLVTRKYWNTWVAVVVIAAIGATFVAAQFLQNGRGLLGIYGQYPFRSAFVDFQYREQMTSKIALQEWLLERTARDDSVAVWTDPQRLAADAAAMQLWGGYNIFTTQAVLDRNTTARLEEIRPTAIAMYSPDQEQIDSLYESLPPWALPSDMECTSEPYLGVGTGEVIVCLTRLTWVG